MDFVLLIALLISTVSVTAKVFDGRKESQTPKIETESRMYEIDKKKLQQYWQFATSMGMIKAHTRSVLQNLPNVERVVFEQCVKEAKTVVATAKCAVRVFDAKEYLASTLPPAQQYPYRNQKFLKQIFVTPSKNFAEPRFDGDSKGSSNNLAYAGYYYSALQHRWIQNPIRRQRPYRYRRTRRDDEIMKAYDVFLEEQRIMKKTEDAKKHVLVEKPEVERNAFGLPRYMSMPHHERMKRDLEAASTLEPIVRNGSTPKMNFPRLASKYIQHFLGKPAAPQNHLENVRKIRNHFLRVEKCNGYFKLMNDENKKVFDHLNLGINSETPKIANNDDAFQKIVDIVNQFSASEEASKKFSFLSPRILSIMPEGKRKNQFLSPTIFSFQKDGFFSLPDIFEIVSSNQRYQQIMLEGIMDLSGAGIAMEELIEKLKPEMQFMEEVQYPLVQQLSKKDIHWLKARQTFTNEQMDEYDKYGFAHLSEEQIRHIYHEDPTPYLAIANLTRSEREARVEKEIRTLAEIGKPKWPFWNKEHVRAKRAGTAAAGDGDHDGHPDIPNFPEEEMVNGVAFITLKPHAFANLINFGVSMEAMILSPHAFVSEIMRPEALKFDLLSPRAFIATILSPSALVARVLSPTAFRGEVLSPRALTAWVLSPEVMIAEVLSPRFLEPRILSPEAMVIDVLSPGILAPHVLSSEAVGVMILSPNILSPRVASEEKFLVEILSPHILGGPHSKEEEESNIEVGSHSSEHNHGHGENKTAAGHGTAGHGSGHGATVHTDHHAARNHGILHSLRSQPPKNPFSLQLM